MKTSFGVSAAKRILLFMLVAATILFLCLAKVTPAHALTPLELKQSVTDPQNVLTDTKNRILESIKEVKEKTNQNIWVVFVPTFEPGEEDINGDAKVDSQDWIQDTASKSHLGDSDILLAVAVSTHEMAVWISKDSNFLKSRSLDIITNGTMPYLRQAQYGEAVLKFNTSVLRQVESSVDHSPYIIITFLVTVLAVVLIVNGVKRSAKSDSMSFFEKANIKKKLKNYSKLNKTTAAGAGLQDVLDDISEEQLILPSMQKQSANIRISDTSEASTLVSKSIPLSDEASSARLSPTLPSAQSTPMNTFGINSLTTSMTPQQAHVQSSISGRVPVMPQSFLQKSDTKSTQSTSTQDNTQNNTKSVSSRKPDFFASDAITSRSSALSARSASSPTPAPKVSSVEDIYGRYYKQSPSRELYGSYYSDGQAAKHDAQVNKQLLEKSNYLSQKYSSQVSNILKKEDDSTKVYNKYYKDSPKNSFKKRFGI
jgi:hypothetical protein